MASVSPPDPAVGPGGRLAGWLDRRFLISERGSSPARELLAGLTTFIAMVYIVVVNPAVMTASGMDRADVATATIITAMVGSVAIGLSANLPLGLAPSMGSNAFFVIVLVGQMGLSWRAGLAVIFCAGIVILMLSILGIRERLTRAVPDDIRAGLQLSFGLFLCVIAFRQAAIGGDANHPSAFSTFAVVTSTAMTLALVLLRFRAAMIVSVFVTASILHGLSGGASLVTSIPFAWPHWPRHSFLALDFAPLLAHPFHALTAVTFVTFNECVGLLATTVAVARGANLSSEVSSTAAFSSDASSTVLGALLGTATVTPYIESIAGVEAGGRTGLVALVVSAGFAAALFLLPLLGAIPPIATAPAVFVLGLMMMRRGAEDIRASSPVSILASLAMLLTTALTLNLTDALAAGVLSNLHVRWRAGDLSRTLWVYSVSFMALWLLSKSIQ